jgi:hypothetical protein
MFYVLHFPYYDTSLFVTPTWDGATVNRIVLNDIYAKKTNKFFQILFGRVPAFFARLRYAS